MTYPLEQEAELLMQLSAKDELGSPGPGTQAWEDVRRMVARHLAYLAIHNAHARAPGQLDEIQLDRDKGWPLLRSMLLSTMGDEA